MSTLSNWAALGANLAILLFLTPLLIEKLGPEGYGVWAVVLSVIGFQGLFDLGIRSAATRNVAKAIGEGNSQRLAIVLSTSAVFFVFMAVVILLIVLGLAYPFALLLHISPGMRGEFTMVLRVAGIAVALSFPANLLRAVLIAHQRFVANNSTRVAVLIIRAGLVVLVLLLGGGLVLVALCYVIAAVVDLCSAMLQARRLIGKKGFQLSEFRWNTLTELGRYGAKTFVAVVADQFRFNIDSFVITRWIGLAAVTPYRLAAQIMKQVLGVSGGFSTVYIPHFATIHGQGEPEKLERVYLDSLSIGAILGTGLCLTVVVFGGWFLDVWIGDIAMAGVPVLWILAGSYAIALSQSTTIGVLYALNRHKWFAVVSLVEGASNLLISIVLAPRLGVAGVALGTAIPMTIVKLAIQPAMISTALDLPPMKIYSRLIVPWVVAMGGAFLANALGIVSNWQAVGAVRVLTAGPLVIVAYGVVTVLVMRPLGLVDLNRAFRAEPESAR